MATTILGQYAPDSAHSPFDFSASLEEDHDTDQETAYEPAADELAFPIPPRLPPVTNSPPPKAHSIRTASQPLPSGNPHPAGFRQVSQPIPHSQSLPLTARDVSPLRQAAEISSVRGFDFSSPSFETRPLDFTTFNDPFRGGPIKTLPHPAQEDQLCEGDMGDRRRSSVIVTQIGELESQEENSPHEMSSATSSSDSGSEKGRGSVDSTIESVEAPTMRASNTSGPVQLNHKPRPRSKSFFSRIRRQPVPTDDDFEPVEGPRVSGRGIENMRKHELDESSQPQKTKRKSTLSGFMEKQNSRKPTPKSDSRKGRKDDDSELTGLGFSVPLGSRVMGTGVIGEDRPRSIVAGLGRTRRSEDAMSVIGHGGYDEDDESLDVHWDKLKMLPRVTLHPPEEGSSRVHLADLDADRHIAESSGPITLYPPPSLRPQLRAQTLGPPRPSRPTSLFSVQSSGSAGSNVWGGMSTGFQKPPPVFKRSPNVRGATLPSGIVMPKSRAQVKKEVEWRMSLVRSTEEDDDTVGEWGQGRQSTEEDRVRESFETARQFASPPRTGSPIQYRPQRPESDPGHGDMPPRPPTPTMRRGSSPPPIIEKTVEIPERSASAPPTVDFGSSPPPLILTDPHMPNSTSVDQQLTEESTDRREASTAPIPPLQARPGQSPTSELARESLSSSSSDATFATAHESRQSSEDKRPTPPSSARASAEVPGDLTKQTLQGTNKFGKNRRSLSLVSISLGKKKEEEEEEAPPVPIVQPKAIRKQRSLKNFFLADNGFSRGENVPALPKVDREREKALTKEKERQRVKEKEEREKEKWLQRVKEKEMEKQMDLERQKEKDRLKEERHQKRSVEKAAERERKASLPRHKSKPSLTIDVQASRDLPVPSVPPLPNSAPPSVPADFRPETPASGGGSSMQRPGRSSTVTSESSLGGRLSKRFSLTNMSGAFRKSKRNLASAANGGPPLATSAPPVPQVPDLPEMYRKEKAAKGKGPWHLPHVRSQGGKSQTPTASEFGERTRRSEDGFESVKTRSMTSTPRSESSRKMSLPEVHFGGGAGSFLSREEEEAYMSPPASPQIPQTAIDGSPAENSPALSLSRALESAAFPSPSAAYPTPDSARSSALPPNSVEPLKSDMPKSSSKRRFPHNASISSLSRINPFSHKTRSPISPDAASILSDTSSTFELEAELHDAQLVLVSPRTRKDPAYSLQTVMGIAPLQRGSVIVEPGEGMTRRSIEAIVVGPELVPRGQSRTNSSTPTSLGGSLAGSPIYESHLELEGGSEDGETASYAHSTPTPTQQLDSPLQIRGDGGGEATEDHVTPEQAQAPPTSNSDSSLASLSRSVSSSEPSDPSCATPGSPLSEAMHFPMPFITAGLTLPFDEMPDLPTVYSRERSDVFPRSHDEFVENPLQDTVGLEVHGEVETSPNPSFTGTTDDDDMDYSTSPALGSMEGSNARYTEDGDLRYTDSPEPFHHKPRLDHHSEFEVQGTEQSTPGPFSEELSPSVDEAHCGTLRDDDEMSIMEGVRVTPRSKSSPALFKASRGNTPKSLPRGLGLGINNSPNMTPPTNGRAGIQISPAGSGKVSRMAFPISIGNIEQPAPFTSNLEFDRLNLDFGEYDWSNGVGMDEMQERAVEQVV